MISDLSKHWSLGYPVAFCKQLIVTRYQKFRLVFADSWVDGYGSCGLVACLFILYICLFIPLCIFIFYTYTFNVSYIHIYIHNILWLPYWMEYTLTFNSSHIECYTCPGHLCLTSGVYILTILIKKPSYFRLVWNRHLLQNGFAKKGRKKRKETFFLFDKSAGLDQKVFHRLDVSNKTTMIFLSCRKGCILLKTIQKVTCL